MTEKVIEGLINEYDIKNAQYIQNVLADLFGGAIKLMMKAEKDEHLGYEKNERTNSSNAINGYKSKKIRIQYGEFDVDVPQDRDSSFEPKIVPKRNKDISKIDNIIISMYARGMRTRQISDQVEDIYGFDVNESFVSKVTDKILPKIKDWQNRILDSIYPIVFIDAVHFSVDGIVKKLTAYVVLGIALEGIKEVLGLYIGKNESSKYYWSGIFNKLKNRGLNDILILCADGLTGIKQSIQTAYPDTEYQRCIVHKVRKTLKYISYKNKKEYTRDLKTIYSAATEEYGFQTMESVVSKLSDKYPNSIQNWRTNWDTISPINKFSKEVRKVIYTTNAIESLNSYYKRIKKQRSVFPTPESLLKALYLATKQVSKK